MIDRSISHLRFGPLFEQAVRTDEQMDGWMDGRLDGWMDRWSMDRCMMMAMAMVMVMVMAISCQSRGRGRRFDIHTDIRYSISNISEISEVVVAGDKAEIWID